MGIYEYFVLGIVLGLSIAVYFFLSREERIEKSIIINKEVFSTEKLDNTMETVVDRIKEKISKVNRNLTEEEKNEIIEQCYREKFNIQ